MKNGMSRPYRTLKAISFSDLDVAQRVYRPGLFPTHAHPNARFVFVLAGTFTEDYAGRQRECREGTTLFRPPREPHSEVFGPKPVVSISVDLGPKWFDHLRDCDLPLSRSVSIRTGSAVGFGTKLDAEMTMNDSASRLAIEAILFEAAVAASRAPEATGDGRSPQWLRRAVDFLHAAHGGSPTLADVSRVAAVHPAHLARVFRRVYGCSVGTHMRRIRIEAARSLLAASNAPLADIAMATGFTDQSHLCRVFKQFVGVTPGHYRVLARQCYARPTRMR
jgi:AraC family transcriptional regulator